MQLGIVLNTLESKGTQSSATSNALPASADCAGASRYRTDHGHNSLRPMLPPGLENAGLGTIGVKCSFVTR